MSAPPPPPPSAPLPPPVLADPGAHVPAKEGYWRRMGGGSLTVSILVHSLLLIIALLLVWTNQQQVKSPPDFTSGGGGGGSHEKAKRAARQSKQMAAPSMRLASSAQAPGAVSLPDVSADLTSMNSMLSQSGGGGMSLGRGGSGAGGGFGSGRGPGSGSGFGPGSGAGFTANFMGIQGNARRVVYVVDYSLSMRAKGKKDGVRRDELLRKELWNSVRKLPPRTDYQIIMFSGRAWAHDIADDTWLKDGPDHPWGKNNKNLLDLIVAAGASSGKFPDYTFPAVKYLQVDGMSGRNLKRSKKVIENLPLSLGTAWDFPLLMALEMRPQPEMIFFLTDGTPGGDPDRQVNLVTKANRGLTTIHATAMMDPKAIAPLSRLAKGNKGHFTIVEEDGSILKEDEIRKRFPNLDL